MFYIKKIIFYTRNNASTVDLIPGLNIIYGPSNTGKSMILECMHYMLGASESNFNKKLGVRAVKLVLDVDGHILTLSRNTIDEIEFVDVNGNVPGIEPVSYSTTGKSGSPHLNLLWLKLMGLSEGIKIMRTNGGDLQALTPRTFYHTYIIDEDRVHGKKSVLSGNGLGNAVGTPVLTALLYLATQNNYLPEVDETEKKARKSRKAGVVWLVGRGIEYLEEKKRLLQKSGLTDKGPQELQQEIGDILNSIGVAQDMTDNTLKECKQLGQQISDIQQQLSEDETLMDRNKLLLSQYQSDIRRLTFIAEGDIIEQGEELLSRCPFCNSPLSHDSRDSCLDAAIAEEKKIEVQVRDLLSVQQSLKEEHSRLQKEQSFLIEQREGLEERIRLELEPQMEELRSRLMEYRTALNIAKSTEMIEGFAGFLKQEQDEVNSDDTVELHFNAKDKFKEVFKDVLEAEIDQLLYKCAYQGYLTSWFDFKEDDIVVNSNDKRNQGKGYRAFLNTIVAVAVQNCLEQFGKYHPALLVIDSPVLSLKEKDSGEEGSKVPEPMREHLFEYFVNRKGGPQTIIIENEIPRIAYTDANMVHFTGDKERGRYGLIDGYYE